MNNQKEKKKKGSASDISSGVSNYLAKIF
jgi:hypothetical protein